VTGTGARYVVRRRTSRSTILFPSLKEVTLPQKTCGYYAMHAISGHMGNGLPEHGIKRGFASGSGISRCTFLPCYPVDGSGMNRTGVMCLTGTTSRLSILPVVGPERNMGLLPGFLIVGESGFLVLLFLAS